MIARYFILLPFDHFVTENAEWPIVILTMGDIQVRIHSPGLYAERSKPTDSFSVQGITKASPPSFTENLMVNNRKVAQVNVLILDFIKPDFDRSANAPSIDPKPELWRLRYLTDDLMEFEDEEGKWREVHKFPVTVGYPALTPETLQMVAAKWQAREPYIWDQLLLDAQAQLPDVGSAIVMAYAALETFISWALEILHNAKPLPDGLWKWIRRRDHWSKEPSVSEQFDTLLTVFTGRSLKQEEPRLWQSFIEIRKARNSVAHEGTAGKNVDAAKAKEFVNYAEKIIAWVEFLLPEPYRRSRTTAAGPFVRMLITPEEAASLGTYRVKSNEIGVVTPGVPAVELPPGASLGIDFEPKAKPDVGPSSQPE